MSASTNLCSLSSFSYTCTYSYFIAGRGHINGSVQEENRGMFFLPCEFWRSNSGYQVYWQTPSLAEPSHQPSLPMPKAQRFTQAISEQKRENLLKKKEKKKETGDPEFFICTLVLPHHSSLFCLVKLPINALKTHL